MAKILHTADCKLGSAFPDLGFAGEKVREIQKATFKRIIDLALDEKVDLFLVAGDLFASNLVSKGLVEFVLDEVGRLGEIPAVVLPGDCDAWGPDSVYHWLPFLEVPKNFYLVTLANQPLFFEKIDVSVSGIPVTSSAADESTWKELKKPEEEGHHILLVHGQPVGGKDSDAQPPFVRETAVEKAGFDYVALGHQPAWAEKSLDKGKAVNPGYPEPLDFEQEASGKVAVVKISRSRLDISSETTGSLTWVRQTVPASKLKTAAEIHEMTKKHKGEKNLCEVVLEGEAEHWLDLEKLYDDLAPRFLSLRIDDRRTYPDLRRGSREIVETTILGQYRKFLQGQWDGAEGGDHQLVAAAWTLGQTLLSKDISESAADAD